MVALVWDAHPKAAEAKNGVGLTALEVAVQQNRPENASLLQDTAAMKTMADNLRGATIGRANQLTYTVVSEMNSDVPANSFLPGTASLVEQLDTQIMICLRDGDDPPPARPPLSLARPHPPPHFTTSSSLPPAVH